MPKNPNTLSVTPSTTKMLGTFGDFDLADVMSAEDLKNIGDWRVKKGEFSPEIVETDPLQADVRDRNREAGA